MNGSDQRRQRLSCDDMQLQRVAKVIIIIIIIYSGGRGAKMLVSKSEVSGCELHQPPMKIHPQKRVPGSLPVYGPACKEFRS